MSSALANLFNSSISYVASNEIDAISGNIKFTNGTEFTFNIGTFALEGCYTDVLTIKEIEENENSENQDQPFVPKGFGYNQMGIADYKKSGRKNM